MCAEYAHTCVHTHTRMCAERVGDGAASDSIRVVQPKLVAREKMEGGRRTHAEKQ